MPLIDDTLLTISIMGVPRWSARGLQETFTQIAASAYTRRTINGRLDDLSFTPFQLYALKLTCTDQRTPAFEFIWPGQIVQITPVTRFTSNSNSFSGSPSRSAVSGSERSEDEFDSYQASLNMMLIAPISIQTDEWNATIGWTADFEEVGGG